MRFNPIESSIGETKIFYARILDVDVSSYSVTVATEFAKKPMSGISWATPYQHFVNGEGVYVMPEVGSLCWVCEPSDGSRPFVLAWASAQEEGDFRARRVDLNPGDIYLGTRDENALILRRGGVVQIGSGPLCQRIYLPIQNTIKEFCENYSLQSLAGTLEWTVEREEGTTDGKRPTALTISARLKSSDKAPISILKMGSHDDDTVLSLLIKASGEDGADTKISLLMDKDGGIKWEIKKDFELKVDGKLNIEVKEDISISSTSGKMELLSSQAFNAKGSEAKMEADTTATLKGGASAVVDAPSVKLGGDAATSPAVKGDQLMTWLATHTHPVTALGVPTGPPAQAGSVSGLVSSTVLLK